MRVIDEKRYRAHGWVRGLIHFHTRFSDGWATVQRAAEIAKKHRFDFLIVTDHLQDLKLKTHRTLADYLSECDLASRAVGIPVIPGGEMEVEWNNPVIEDFSEAHTIAFWIRDLVLAGEFDMTTPGTKPYEHWQDSRGERGTILALQEKLLAYNVPPAASHQFQHSPLSNKRGAHSDYRYDLARFEKSQYLDFFYSGAVDVIHESEDLELITEYVQRYPPKAVYTSCDHHVGPETLPAVADAFEGVPSLKSAYSWLFSNVAGFGLRFFGDPETASFPEFADEQLSHATYVHLGDRPCTEQEIREALRQGRTCVARGRFVFEDLDPVPGFAQIRSTGVQISLKAPVTYSEPRPRSVLLFEDGRLVCWKPYVIGFPEIEFTYVDPRPKPGTHLYQLYVPSKFLSSPIIV